MLLSNRSKLQQQNCYHKSCWDEERSSVHCASLPVKPVKRFDLLVVGAPVVDRTIEGTAEQIRRAGVEVGSAAADPDAKAAAFKAMMNIGTIDATTPGGSPLNTTLVAAGRFNTKAAFIGCVGDDADGDLLRKAASDVGVQWFIPPIIGETTAVAAVVVEKESRDRTIMILPGVAPSLCPAHLQTNEVTEALHSSKILYVTSFILRNLSPPRVAVVDQMAKAAYESDAVFALNLSSVGLQAEIAMHILKLLPYTTLLFGNEKEWEAFGESAGLNGGDGCLHAVASRLASGGYAVMTQGADAVVVVNAAHRFEFPVAKIPKEEIVDTNGAGDSFVAGFLAGYAANSTLGVCVALGQKASGQTLRMRGC